MGRITHIRRGGNVMNREELLSKENGRQEMVANQPAVTGQRTSAMDRSFVEKDVSFVKATCER